MFKGMDVEEKYALRRSIQSSVFLPICSSRCLLEAGDALDVLFGGFLVDFGFGMDGEVEEEDDEVVVDETLGVVGEDAPDPSISTSTVLESDGLTVFCGKALAVVVSALLADACLLEIGDLFDLRLLVEGGVVLSALTLLSRS